MTIIALGNWIPALGSLGIWSGILTFVMCYISKYEIFDFCPGIFVGCFSTFASNGNYFLLIVSLICGAFLGLACDMGSSWLQHFKR